MWKESRQTQLPVKLAAAEKATLYRRFYTNVAIEDMFRHVPILSSQDASLLLLHLYRLFVPKVC